MILAPGAVMTGNHEMYKVFTPFKNARLKRLKEDIPPCVPAPKIRVSGALSTPLTPVSLNYPQQAFDAALFPVEENAVIAQLRQFCAQGADGYESQRDFPAVEGTSRLSASGDGRPVAATVPAPITGGAAAGAGRRTGKRLVE